MTRVAVQLILLQFLATHMDARAIDCDHGISPNRAYKVRVAETARTHAITYDLIERTTGKTLLRIPSSYQPDAGELQNWSWNHATDAEIRWSHSSHCLFIDEQVHNHIGEVFVVAVHGHQAKRVPLPERAILQKSGHTWERHRIRVAEEYEGRDDVIALRIGGRVESDTPGTTVDRCFDFSVKLRHCQVVSIGPFRQVY